jgi:hypothetical protein
MSTSTLYEKLGINEAELVKAWPVVAYGITRSTFIPPKENPEKFTGFDLEAAFNWSDTIFVHIKPCVMNWLRKVQDDREVVNSNSCFVVKNEPPLGFPAGSRAGVPYFIARLQPSIPDVDIETDNFFQVVYPIDGQPPSTYPLSSLPPNAANYVMRALTAQIGTELATDAFKSKVDPRMSARGIFDELAEHLHGLLTGNPNPKPAIVVHVHGAGPDEVLHLVNHTTQLYHMKKCPRFYFVVSGDGASVVEDKLKCSAYDLADMNLIPPVGWDPNQNPSMAAAGGLPPRMW